MADFGNVFREELARAQFHDLFGDPVDLSSSIGKILDLEPKRRVKKQFQHSLTKAEHLPPPRLVKQPCLARPKKL